MLKANGINAFAHNAMRCWIPESRCDVDPGVPMQCLKYLQPPWPLVGQVVELFEAHGIEAFAHNTMRCGRENPDAMCKAFIPTMTSPELAGQVVELLKAHGIKAFAHNAADASLSLDAIQRQMRHAKAFVACISNAFASNASCTQVSRSRCSTGTMLGPRVPMRCWTLESRCDVDPRVPMRCGT